MGTNYYLHQRTGLPKPDHEIVLHIGKSSTGWCFSVHVMPERGINDLQDWVTLIEQRASAAVIKDEYGEELQLQELLGIITDRRRSQTVDDAFIEGKKHGFCQYADTVEQWLRLNHAVRGPNNLIRPVLGGTVLRHGSGTWDCIVGDFS
jgi:hypothetical protein